MESHFSKEHSMLIKKIQRVEFLKEQLGKERRDSPHKYHQVRKRVEFLIPFKYEQAKILNIHPRFLTGARMKMWQLLHEFPLITKKKVTYFDNAAFPGSFIIAVDHFCNEHGIDLSWYANSICAPGYLDDSFQLQDKYPDRWMMSEQKNGDVSDLNNIYDIINRMDEKVDLYTSDLGMNVGERHSEQETIHSKPFVGHLLLGLHLLKQGGCIVLKQYSMDTELSKSIIEILKRCFKKIEITKPFFSKDGNDESYIVGIHRTEIDKSIIASIDARMRERKWDAHNPIIPVTEDVRKIIYDVSVNLRERQIVYLENTLSLIRDEPLKHLFVAKKPLIDLWLKKFSFHKKKEK